MRPLFVCGLLVSACATAGPAPLPQRPNWIQRQHIAVEGPVTLEMISGDQKPLAAALRESIEGDLRTAGFDVAAPNPDALLLRLDAFVRTGYDHSSLRATLLQAGRQVERFEVAGKSLPCLSSAWALYERENAKCFGRALVASVMNSARIEQALAAPVSPQAPVVPPGSGARAGQPIAGPPRLLQLRGKLAVLDLKNYAKDLTRENAQYFTDVIRQAALKMQPGLDIMTRENLMVLLQSSGRKLDDCEGECEVDTGRRIGADQIISGEIQRVGSKFKLTLRLHETGEGKLLASSIGSGKSIDELDEGAQKAAEDLFKTR